MLDINFIKKNPDLVKTGLSNKGFQPEKIDQLLGVNKKRVELIAEIEKLRQERNTLGKEDLEKGRKIKEQLQKLEPALKAVEEELENILLDLPNLPAPDVPIGKSESDNQVIKTWGKIPQFDFEVKDHLEIGEKLDLIDVERAGKVSGSRFSYLKNEGVILEFALVQLALETLVKEGFQPLIPPVIISLESMAKMGYLGSGSREDMYILDKDNQVLVGTSEQSIGPMYAGEVLKSQDLPKRYLGFSTCFRREAGSYGKDTRGILRVHQFNKAEMFSFTTSDQSDSEHEFLLQMEEKLMQALDLPYQVVKICTGDLGLTAFRKYDLEAWFPAQKCYRETHSTSNCTDYQARSLNIKYQAGEKAEFVHTLNGTAFSERPLIAILENYQQADGSVKVPEILQKYTGFSEIKPKR